MCYICHDGRNLIDNPCGHCSLKVHYNCLISHLIANWSMQEDGYSYKNCSICRRRYPNYIIRDMLSEIDELEQNSPISPNRNLNNYQEEVNVLVNQNNPNINIFKCIKFTFYLFLFVVFIYLALDSMTNLLTYESKKNVNNSTILIDNLYKINTNYVIILSIILILLFTLIFKTFYT